MDTPAQSNTPSTTPPPAIPSQEFHKESHSSSSNNNLLKTIIVVIIVALLATSGFVSYQLYQKNNELKNIKMQEETQTSQITLPKNLVKISGCLPYMGEHWIEPQNIPRGPYYVTYNGKITAIEYMYKPEEIPGQTVATASPSGLIKYMQDNKISYADLFKNNFVFDISGLKVKFMELTWSPPHAGFITPHYDMHYYFISKEESEKICPNAKPEEAQTPLIEQELQKYNIPFIPMNETPAPTSQTGSMKVQPVISTTTAQPASTSAPAHF
jgi:hypothetical protein